MVTTTSPTSASVASTAKSSSSSTAKAATPAERIRAQHVEATELVRRGMECLPCIDHGEIPLVYKRRPTNVDPFYSSTTKKKVDLEEADGQQQQQRRGRGVNGRCLDDPPVAVATADDHRDLRFDAGEKGVRNEEEKKECGGVGGGISGDDDDGASSGRVAVGGGESRGGTSTSTRVCISSRGTVDVTAIARLVEEGYNDPTTAPAAAAATKNTTKKKPPPQKKKNNTSGGKIINNDIEENNDDDDDKNYYSPTNLWDERNASRNNVAVTRPSHDNWGIKKIVLIFCDDFLRDVYEMPWWWSRRQNDDDDDDGGGDGGGTTCIGTEMRRAITPILSLLSVRPQRVVRLLLASLPPGVTIPVHHDTGEWVKHTHRVHVPIIVTDPTKVLFRCGPTDDDETLDRISVHVGHVFEMNNQARHAVSNCHPTDHRVHLILDYVDESYRFVKERIRLEPGEKLLQTRRSIDRLCDRGSRPTPSYAILGAQKCGTTSLYDYLNQHPWIVGARRRETHCLDWRWKKYPEEEKDGAKTTTTMTVEEQRSHCQKFFYAKELSYHPSCMTGDSTPSYLLQSDIVIPRMKRVFPWGLRFIVMLRDPVKRAYSQYRMVTSDDGTPEQKKHRGTDWLDVPFEDVVKDEFEKMDSVGLIPYWDIKTQTMVDRDRFDTFVGTKEEREAFSRYQDRYCPMMRGSHSILVRGLYALNLRPWFDAFPMERFLVMKLEDMQREEVKVVRTRRGEWTMGEKDGEGGRQKQRVGISDYCDDGKEREGGESGGVVQDKVMDVDGDDDEDVVVEVVSGVQHMVNRALDHLDLPRCVIEDTSPKNTREYEPIREETKALLRRFYEPHNRLLGTLLDGEEWEDPWTY